MVRKNIGNTSFDSPLEQVNYKFNIRGWLTDINDVNRNTDNLFAFKIKYHDSDKGDNPFNGNIGETLWKINNGATKSYAYHYDGLNRLLLGKSTEVSNSIVSTNQYDERIYGYDFNGNILGLSRNTIGHELSLNGIQSIDQLEYQYKPNSNQLESVNDLTSNEQGFNDKNTTGADYEYDLNGNLKKDLNKNITNIAYNHLNLPIEVLFNNNGELSKIKYLYDASGVKVSKHVHNNLLIPYSENTFYDNGFQYKQSAGRGNNLSLQFFPTAEGYVNVNEGIFEYVYNYTDHLGNVRLSYTKGEDGNRKIVDENSYYPFGLKHNNQSIVNTANPNYKYKYQGQELQDEFGLGWYFYKFRNYNSEIARFMNVDPLSEDYEWQSVYSFSSNQPIHAPELEGLESGYDLNNRDPELELIEMTAGSINSVRASFSNLAVRGINIFTNNNINKKYEVENGALVLHKNVPKESTGEKIINTAGDVATLALTVIGGVEGTLTAQGGKTLLTNTINDIKKSVVKTYQTYTKTNKKTGEVYSGRTSGTGTPLENIANRDKKHHMNEKGFGPAVLDKSSTDKNAIKGREQYLIQKNGGAKSQGGTSGNAINGISPNNKKRTEYINAAKVFGL